jgi:hypothetical protein
VDKELVTLSNEVRELRAQNKQLKRFIEIENILRAQESLDDLLPLIMTEVSKSLSAD